MAAITFTIDDALVTRVLDGFALAHRYQETIQDPDVLYSRHIPNPETKSQFLKKTIKNIVIQSVKSAEAKQAGKSARQAKLDDTTVDQAITD